jgi:hypothetical protein
MNKNDIYEDYIKTLNKTSINGLLCHSKAGLGKTYTTVKLLKENKIDYEYVSGVTTAVSFYKTIVENSGKVIVFDDIETMFTNEKIINLLKACLWEVDGKRIVSYKTSSPALEGYPDRIVFEGKIIMLMNEVKGKYDESFKALMSRMLKYELKYTFDEVRGMACEIVDTKNLNTIIKNEVKQYIMNEITPEQNFNFRLLERLIAFFQYDKTKAGTLFEESVDVDADKKVMLDIIRRRETVNEQVKEYYEMTGRSRMTFFRNKKKLKNEGLL